MNKQSTKRARYSGKSGTKKQIQDSHPFNLFWKDHPQLFLFILALVIRLIFVSSLINRPGFAIPIVDEIDFDRMARLFASSLSFEPGPLFRPPLWPLLLGVMYIIFGPIFPIARLINSVLGALAVVAAYRLGKRLFNIKIAFISGIVLSFYGMLVHFNTTGLATSLLIYLVLEALNLSLLAHERGRSSLFFWSGVLWGLAALARPVALLPAAIIAVYLLLIRPDEHGVTGLRRFQFYFLGLVLAIAPITIRNYLQGDLALISTNGGINFYLGNNDRATGFTATHPVLDVYWTPEDIHKYAERQVGRRLTPTQVSSYYAREALRFMEFQSAKASKLLLKKLYLTFNRIEIGNNGDINFFAHRNPLLAALMIIGFGIVAPFGLTGMVMGWKKSSEHKVVILVALSYLLMTVIFFVAARFRLPAVPILSIFAVYAASQIAGDVGRNPLLKKIVIAEGVLAFGLIIHSNFYRMSEGDTSYGYFLQGQVLAREGKMEEAIESFDMALKTYYYVPLANYYIGHIYLKQGKPDLTIEYCQRELEMGENRLAYIDLGKAYRLLNRRSEAEVAFTKAYEFNPRDDEVRSLLAQEIGERAITAADEGRWEEAKKLFLNSGLIDPKNPFYPFGVAGAHWALGDTIKANAIINEVLYAHPEFPPAVEWKNGWRPDVKGEGSVLISPQKPEFLPTSEK